MNKSLKFIGLSLLLGVGAAIASACFADSPIYKDSSQPVEKRVADLLSRMTLEEKVAQMAQRTLNGLEPDANGNVSKASLDELFDGLSPGTVESPFVDVGQVSQISAAADNYLREHTRLGIPAIQKVRGLKHRT